MADVSVRLQNMAGSGTLAVLRWPTFSDYQPQFKKIYLESHFLPVWSAEGLPTPQALAIIKAIGNCKEEGLDPEEYDASRWPARIATLQTRDAGSEAVADFDAALTVSTMRYVSDLQVGRVDPSDLNFDLNTRKNRYDLPVFLNTQLFHAPDVPAVLASVEPTYDGYKRTKMALGKYTKLAAMGDGAHVPEVAKNIAPGASYAGSAALAARLDLLGDAATVSAPGMDSATYDAALIGGVKHFQARHGELADGRLTPDTIRQLNVPLADRVVQLNDALSRWRSLPPAFPQPPVVVNIPEFILRAFGPNQTVALTMNVVVGKSLRTQTPVFAKDMRYIVFRPYWNVPPSIVRGEMIHSIEEDRKYLARRGFEVTDSKGAIITSGSVSNEVLAQLRAGRLMVRQRPGPTNALGLIKFIFPNADNVYLHSTPAPELFAHSRRDFSHGCVRVEQPAELAAYLLRNQPPWDVARAQAAMESGPNNTQVNLSTPVPVLILYLTAVVEPDDTVHFFDDIYGHDKALNAMWAKGPPYPVKP